jgi:hypothetical protein
MVSRPVEDLLTCVIADRPRRSRLEANTQVTLSRAEHHAVEVVDGFTVQPAGLDDPVHRRDQIGDRVKAQVAQRHKRVHGLQFDAQPGGITKGSI